MATLRWETRSRYYAATVQPSLFGGVVVQTCWGGKTNNKGGQREETVPDMVEARAALYRIAQRRAQRNYKLIMPEAAPPALISAG